MCTVCVRLDGDSFLAEGLVWISTEYREKGRDLWLIECSDLSCYCTGVFH